MLPSKTPQISSTTRNLLRSRYLGSRDVQQISANIPNIKEAISNPPTSITRSTHQPPTPMPPKTKVLQREVDSKGASGNKAQAKKNPSQVKGAQVEQELQELEEVYTRGLSKLSQGHITAYDSEVLLATTIEGTELDQAFHDMRETYLQGKSGKAEQKAALLKLLLGYLRASHWIHWTSHWQVHGENFYGDHLLMEKIYKAIKKDIDTLAEKMVGMAGGQIVNPLEQTYFLLGFVNEVCHKEYTPIERAFLVEKNLQTILKRVYEELKGMKEITLGMDDFIMQMANDHETFLYLLTQRLTEKK